MMNVKEYGLFTYEDKRIYLEAVAETKVTSRSVVNRPDRVADMIVKNYRADELPEEHVWLLALNCRQIVNGIFEIAKGSKNAALIDVPAVLQRGLLVGAAELILVHNHLSGNPLPSEDDVVLTRAVKQGADFCGMKLVDHIVIAGKQSYFSFMEHKAL